MSTKGIQFGNIVSDVHYGIIAHGCNAQGVMGSGVALEIRNRFPGAYDAYLEKHRTDGLTLGDVIYYEHNESLTIANAITQQFYGKDGKKYVSYEAIHKAFTRLAFISHAMDKPIHYPMIGAGLGGGDWSVISDIIDSAFSNYSKASRILWIKE